MSAIERYGGHVAKYLGDGILAYFGYPAAHEEDARSAVLAALDIERRFHSRRQVIEEQAGVSPHYRIGIHTGLVVAGEMGSGLTRERLAIVGETPNIAARLQDAALPDSALISGEMRELVDPFFELVRLGQPELKGVSRPIEAYQVVAENAVSRADALSRRRSASLTGREAELLELAERWSRAQRGASNAILVMGEPGVGKTRLVRELESRVSDDGGAIVHLHCSFHGRQSPLLPILQQLEQELGAIESNVPLLDRVSAALAARGVDSDERVAVIESLLARGIEREDLLAFFDTPEQQKRLATTTLEMWLTRNPQRRPVLLVVDDLQWADPSTEEIISLVVGNLGDQGCLVVATSRGPILAWGGAQLQLSRLPDGESARIVEQLTRGSQLSSATIETIVARSDGNPLFLEELSRMMREAAEEEPSEVDQTLDQRVPTTLNELLSARVDRLGPAKRTAQIASVIGREFSRALLEASSPDSPSTIGGHLEMLVADAVLDPLPTKTDERFAFRHALVMDAANATLVTSSRQTHHRRVAEALSSVSEPGGEGRPEEIARHYAAAGQSAQAIPFLERAATVAYEQAAYDEVLGQLTRALELSQEMGDDRERDLRLETALFAPTIALHGYAAADLPELCERARRPSAELTDARGRFQATLTLTGYHNERAEFRESRGLCDQLIAIAEEESVSLALWANLLEGQVTFPRGDFPVACRAFQAVVDPYDPDRHAPRGYCDSQDPAVTALSKMSWALWIQGRLAEAVAASEQARWRAESLGHAYSAALAQMERAGLAQLVGNVEETAQLARASLDRGRELAADFIEHESAIRLGWAEALQGDRAGLRRMRGALDAKLAAGRQAGQPHHLGMLAHADAQMQDLEASRETLNEALARAAQTGERYYEPELHRSRGEVFAADPATHSEAEESLETAVDLAREQAAHSFELRALLSFGAVLHVDVAGDLAEVVDRFNGEPDQPDLLKARLRTSSAAH